MNGHSKEILTNTGCRADTQTYLRSLDTETEYCVARPCLDNIGGASNAVWFHPEVHSSDTNSMYSAWQVGVKLVWDAAAKKYVPCGMAISESCSSDTIVMEVSLSPDGLTWTLNGEWEDVVASVAEQYPEDTQFVPIATAVLRVLSIPHSM